MLDNHPLFESGQNGYNTYRIPSLLVAGNGDLLAFCEGRRDSQRDSGQIDLLLKRSSDNGATWSERSVVVSEPGMTCGNPCPVVDRDTGHILMPFSKNRADGGQSLIAQGKAPRTVWLTRSEDDGQSWTEPREITGQVKKSSWTWYATGPGHGLQLSSGRIIIPCDHNVGVYFKRGEDPYGSHLIYSDDHGENWHIGAILSLPGNECCVSELDDGTVYLNSRTRSEHGVRSYGFSYDAGLSFLDEGFHSELVEPRLHAGGCQGSLLKLDGNEATPSVLLFCNPATDEEQRRRLTIHVSTDNGRSWREARVLCPGLAGYSDMALLPDGRIACLYETGDESYAERLELKTFTPDWLLSKLEKEDL